MPTLRRVILLMVLAASLVALAVSLRSWRGRVLADELRRQMHTATDAELPNVFARIGKLGDEGLPLVAEALGSIRPSLVFAARDHLQRYLTHIEAILPRERPPHLTKLATALAVHSENFGPMASRWTADMAGQMLRLAPNDDQMSREKLLVACETLIRNAARDQSEDILLAQQAINAEQATRDARQPPLDEARGAKLDESWIVEQLAKYDNQPGGGLPLPSVEVPALPILPDLPVADAVETEHDDGRSPRPFDQPNDATRIDENPGRLPRDPQAAPVRLQPRPNAPVQIGGSSEDGPSLGIDSTAETKAIEPVERSDRDTLTVIQDWSSAVQDEREALAVELRRRGFTDRDFRLAEKLTDSDPAVRRKLAEILPRLSGVSASPWLWWLAEDADAEVRLAAMSLLATSSDPTVRGRLRTLADRESNSRVAAQLRKILSARQR